MTSGLTILGLRQPRVRVKFRLSFKHLHIAAHPQILCLSCECPWALAQDNTVPASIDSSIFL